MRLAAWILGICVLFGAAMLAMADAPAGIGPSDPAMPIVPRADRMPPLPPIRTISILSGAAVRYAITADLGRVTLDVMLRVDNYEQLPAFRDCRGGCRLRIYIVQERR